MTTVGFIGLGIMGGPMAANLVKAGFDVIGYNRTPEPTQRLVEQGGHGADSLAEAVRDADVVVTMVPDSPDVEAVALGEDGIYAHAKPGTLDLDRYLGALAAGGYAGWVGLEYVPSGGSADSFAWLPRERRGAA